MEKNEQPERSLSKGLTKKEKLSTPSKGKGGTHQEGLMPSCLLTWSHEDQAPKNAAVNAMKKRYKRRKNIIIAPL